MQQLSHCLLTPPSAAATSQKQCRLSSATDQQDFADALAGLLTEAGEDLSAEADPEVETQNEQKPAEESGAGQKQLDSWMIGIPQPENTLQHIAMSSLCRTANQDPLSPALERSPSNCPPNGVDVDEPCLRGALGESLQPSSQHHTAGLHVPNERRDKNAWLVTGPLHGLGAASPHELEYNPSHRREEERDTPMTDSIRPPIMVAVDVVGQIQHENRIPLPPAHQIIDLIASPAPSGGARFISPQGSSVGTGEIKVLRLKLKPDALGEVEVTLRRVSSEMKVHITVERKETAEALKKDLGFLEDRLGVALSPGSSQSIAISLKQADTFPSAGSQREHYWNGGFTTGESGGHSDFGGGRSPSGKEEAPSQFGRRKLDDEDNSLEPSAAGLVV